MLVPVSEHAHIRGRDVPPRAKRARHASWRDADTATKNAALEAIAAALEARAGEILEANARDMQAGARRTSAMRCSTG